MEIALFASKKCIIMYIIIMESIITVITFLLCTYHASGTAQSGLTRGIRRMQLVP